MSHNNETLDVWVKRINDIYIQSNGERDFKDVLLFSFEEVGRCSQLINRDHDNDIIEIVPNLFKWFCILYAKSGIKKNVSDVIWTKFPGICPYCKRESCECKYKKLKFDYNDLLRMAKETEHQKPQTLNDWQGLFEKIYSRTGDYKMEKNVSHLFEELSELSEVHRLPFVEGEKDLVDMELADVFSWIMGFANYFDQRKKRGRYLLSDALQSAFGNSACPDCSDFRKKHDLKNNCSCSVMPQKLRLVSDYIDETDIEPTNGSPVNNDEQEIKFRCDG